MPKNITIGILVVGAFALLVWGLFFLHPSFGDGAKQLRARFANIDKIHLGTKVTFAGNPVGEVIKIEEVRDARKDGPVGKDSIFPYELTLSLDSSIDVYDSDEVTIRTTGLMGERFIAIVPQRSKDGQAKLLPNGALIYATSSGSVEDTFRDINMMTKKAETSIGELVFLIKKSGETLQQTLHSIEKSSNAMTQFLHRANELDILAQVTTTVKEGQKAIDSLTDALQSSKGVVGQLLNNDELYYRMLTIVNKCDVLVSDMTRYGLLFHLDSGWQRERRRQIATISRLQTMNEFKTYLDQEMQRITVSIDRVVLALDRTQEASNSPSNKESNKILAQTYQNLLSQIKLLEKTLHEHNKGDNKE